MKQIFTLFTVLSLLGVNAQITFDTSIPYGSAMYVRLEDHGKKLLATNNYNVRLYNIDNTIFKDVTIDTSGLNLHTYSNVSESDYVYAMSQYLFDNDSDIEFIFSFFVYTSGVGDGYLTVIYDENGNQEKVFQDQTLVDDETRIQFPPALENASTGSKLLMWDASSSPWSINIYNLPGKIPCFTCSNDTNLNVSADPVQHVNRVSSSVYPNPTSETIQFEYDLGYAQVGSLKIYSTDGALVHSTTLSGNSFRMNIKNFAPGTYQYTITNAFGDKTTNRFVVAAN